MDREVYVTLDEEGEYSEEFDRADQARDAQRLGTGRTALVKRVYEYSHEEIVEWPGTATEWPPTEEAQEHCGQRFAR